MSEKIETLVDVSPPTPGDEPEDNAQLSAAEQDTEPSPVLCRSYAGASTGCDGVARPA